MTADGELPRRRDPAVPGSAIAAARERTRLAHDIWAMAGHRSASGTAARDSLIRVILTEATPLIRQSAFRLDETPEIRDTLAAALSDAITYRDPQTEGCGECTASAPCGDHAGDAARAGQYEAVAAVLGLDIEL